MNETGPVQKQDIDQVVYGLREILAELRQIRAEIIRAGLRTLGVYLDEEGRAAQPPEEP